MNIKELSPLVGLPKEAKEIFKLLRAFLPKDGVIPGKNSRQFNQFVDPTYKEIGKYHLKYNEIFIQAKYKLYEICDKKYPKTNINTISDTEIAKRIASFIQKKRKKNELTRGIFRSEIQAYLNAVDNHEYRQFIVSCCEYFILDSDIPNDIILLSNKNLNDEIQKNGGYARYDTPSTRLIKRIIDAQTCGEIDDIIDDCRLSLSTKHHNVMAIYFQIEAKRRIF